MTSFQPLTEQLQVQFSKQRLRIVPSASPGLPLNGADSDAPPRADNPIEEREFTVEVVNQSDRFASFEIEISTPGQPAGAANRWYDVDPKVCAKKPPGDRTTFRVIINRPPIPAINTTLQLAVHIFSVEYDDLETVHHLDLVVEQRSHPLQVHLVSPFLKTYPGERLAIEALAMNLQSEPADITLKLLRLGEEWFTPSEPDDPVEAASPTLLHQTLPGGDTRRLAFYCVPPSQPLIASGVYEFDIEISDRTGNYSTTHGHIEVLPAGWVIFECASRRQTIPAEDLGQDGGDRAIFPLNFENCSNLTQQLHLQAAEVNQHRCTIRPVAPVDLSPGDAQPLNLEVRRRQPWLGWERRLLIEVAPTLTYPDAGIATDPIHLKPSSQTLDLRVRPLIPLWLQLGGGLLALLLLAWWWWLRPVTRHTAPITAVQILGKESTVLTGSRDQTVYRWDVSDALGWFPHAPRLRDRTQLAAADELGRAVRVIRQSPRDEVQVAIGLENGAIELWDIAREERVRPIADRTDRVFALAFTADAQSLFSGHGSGIVRRWDVQASNQSTAEQMLFLNDTAIADLEMLDYDNRSLVAIAGQFNRLVLWDWADETAYTVDYSWDRAFPVAPVIGPYHSLTEVEVSRDGRLLATADNRGFVTLWDGQDFVECTGGSGTPSSLAPSGAMPRITPETIPLPCPTSAVRLDQWQVTDHGVAVRAMALSEDGCYLTTATDDGAIALWTLDPQQRIRDSQVEPIVIDTLTGYSPYEIDIKQRDPGHVLIAVDGPDHRARLYQQAVNPSSACSGAIAP